VTVQDGEEAMFQNASRVPYVSASTYYGGYGGYGGTSPSSLLGATNNTNRVEFIDVGTILTVLPRIADDKTILMDISAEDSTYVDKTLTVNDQKSTVPEKTVRRADTQVRVNTGDTVVLGGLRKDRTSKSMTKTPFLGDLPVVGWLFRSPDKLTSNASLLIFITPTIVDESTSMEAVELMQTDEEMGKDVRHLKKDLWGRVEDNISKGKNEMVVSIGATGRIHSGGKLVSVEELGKTLLNVKKPKSTTLVIRKHPTAPLDIVNGVVEAAMEAGIQIDYEDGGAPPIVPSMSSVEEERAETAAAAAQAPPVTGGSEGKKESAAVENKPEPTEAAPAPKEEKAPEIPAQPVPETKAP
jgi:biopolymer transport protein ExbD